MVPPHVLTRCSHTLRSHASVTHDSDRHCHRDKRQECTEEQLLLPLGPERLGERRRPGGREGPGVPADLGVRNLPIPRAGKLRLRVRGLRPSRWVGAKRRREPCCFPASPRRPARSGWRWARPGSGGTGREGGRAAADAPLANILGHRPFHAGSPWRPRSFSWAPSRSSGRRGHETRDEGANPAGVRPPTPSGGRPAPKRTASEDALTCRNSDLCLRSCSVLRTPARGF